MHSQSQRNGCINVQSFACDPFAFLQCDSTQSSHVVQPVRQLDDDHAHVLCKSKHHFPEVLGLRLLLGPEFQMGEFADPIDQFSHILAKLVGDLPLGRFRVFDHIMQNRRCNCLRIHVHARQHTGYGKRVVI